MRILFVVTNIGVVESYGSMYLSALAKQAGCKTRFVRFNPSLVTKVAREWSPDIIAWSAFSGEFPYMAQLNDKLKDMVKFISIFGGPHPTYFPESLFRYKIDYGVIGEGEHSFIDLLKALQNGSKSFTIGNVITKEKREIDVYPLIEDFDALPMPDYDGYYASNVWLKDFPVKMFIPSRGCPYNCAYCFNHQFRTLYKGKGPIIRRYSVNRLIEEVLFVKRRFALEFVRFNDDCFVNTWDNWLENFCSKYPQKVGLPFFCVINPNNIKDEIIRMLKEAGLKSVFMSIECGDGQYRKSVLNRNISDKQLLDAFSILRKNKINVLSTSILALPGAGFDYDLKTLEMNIKCRPACAIGAIFQPFPKLKLTDYAIENGYYNAGDSYNNLPLTIFGKSILNFPENIKCKQKNLSGTFTLLVKVPFLARLLMPFIGIKLIIFPFVIVSGVLTGYFYQNRIYPHRMTLKRLYQNVTAALSYFSQTFKEK